MLMMCAFLLGPSLLWTACRLGGKSRCGEPRNCTLRLSDHSCGVSVDCDSRCTSSPLFLLRFGVKYCFRRMNRVVAPGLYWLCMTLTTKAKLNRQGPTSRSALHLRRLRSMNPVSKRAMQRKVAPEGDGVSRFLSPARHRC